MKGRAGEYLGDSDGGIGSLAACEIEKDTKSGMDGERGEGDSYGPARWLDEVECIVCPGATILERG